MEATLNKPDTNIDITDNTMRSVVVLTDEALSHCQRNPSLSTSLLQGVPVHSALLSVKKLHFDPGSAMNHNKVFLKVHSFSCNYRDQSMIFASCQRKNAGFYVIGSEFAGEIVAIGPGVSTLSPGDRVIPNCSYHGLTTKAPSGVPTNHASAEYQIIDEDRLMKIPPEMTWAEAASFPVGAQTVYSMVRKLDVGRGSNVLVTAARSNTSLFAISALVSRGANVYALTTSGVDTEKLYSLGVAEVFVVGRNSDSILRSDRVRKVALSIGGFEGVIDPFFDIYLSRVVPAMSPESRYVTCGLWDQCQTTIGNPQQPQDNAYRRAFIDAMMNNVSLICNCLGSRQDLSDAIEDYKMGNLKVIVDSVFDGFSTGQFLARTFGAEGHFGKVVYQY